MKQFAKGNARQFDGLWDRLVAAPKKITYPVVLPQGIRAKLVFSSGNGGVEVKLTCDDPASAASYTGSSEFVRALLRGESKRFNSAAEMRESFAGAAADYAEQQQPQGRKRRIFRGQSINPDTLAAALKERIIGQDGQIEGIARAVCNHLRKKKPQRPLTIMLAGPTGVGKSATARALSEEIRRLTNDESMPLVTVNCNEFREEYRISQLLGSPAGYVGYNDACMLEPFKDTNSGVILFDEFEKAHPSIHTAVMGWMDTGKIIFSHIDEGQTSAEYDCSAAIIVMTSNINMQRGGSAAIRFDLSGGNEPGRSTDFERNDECRRVLVRGGFKPEIAGRISYFFEYSPLSPENVKKILKLSFKAKAREFGAEIESVSDSLLEDMYAKFGASAFGVRPLEYALDDVLGRSIPDISGDTRKKFAADGTIDSPVFTEI